MTNSFTTYTKENGGRVLILFLLFLLAIYEFIHDGYNTFVIICCAPIIILLIYSTFKWRLAGLWLLIIVNYFIPFKLINWHMPVSLIEEGLEMALIAVAIIDARQTPRFERTLNIMLYAFMLWFGLCFIEIFNDTCGLGINFTAWFSGARLMTFQILWIILVFSVYITTPKILITYLRLWACLSLFSACWTWKMINIGLTPEENAFLNGPGSSTHLLQAGTLIRYWSTFTDAANYGCNAAASAVCFLIIALTSRITWERLFFAFVGIFVIWGMFQSGTRTAIICLILGGVVYLLLSKSVRIIVPCTIVLGIFLFILIFTNIGNGNQQIRRMRSAFNKDDASANVRDVNKAAIAKYMKDAPWGVGIGIHNENIPAWNRYKILINIPPDSEYVYIWVRTGPIGVTIFAFCMLIMLGGASYIVLFRLKNRSLIGIGGGLCSAFAAIQLGGYANQVIYQYPNGLIFFGGLAIVYLLPYFETDWIEYEKGRLAKQEESKRLKLEKKLASRV
jgi:O-Antigen ligase.